MATFSENRKFEQLVQRLAPHSRLLQAWDLTGGSSAQMTALEIECPDGKAQRVIVRRPGNGSLKRNPNIAADEFRLLQMMQSLDMATPTPYLLDESDDIFATPYLVIEYIEGKPEFTPSNLADYILQLAVHLVNIHSIDCSNLDLSFLPKKADGCPEVFQSGAAAVDESLDERRIRNTLESIFPVPQRNPSVLLHGDFWPGNVLWQDDILVAVIDWEDATLGEPLTDFAISRLDLAIIFGIDVMNCFTRHYKSLMSLDYTNLPYWDLCAALRFVRLADSNLVEWAAFFQPFGRLDITEQAVRESYSLFITQAFEKLVG